MSYYFWPIFWMAVIFFFSTDAGSFANTSHLIEPVIRFLVPQITPREVLRVHFWIRKLAHFTEYAVLSHLWFTALNRGRPRWALRHAIAALLISILYAAMDEYHQIFVPSRTPSFTDIGIDSTGVVTSQIYHFIRRWRPPGLSVPPAAPEPSREGLDEK
jgi:VanZ family protein